MKKFFYLLICLTLAACGSGKTASISSDTSSVSSGASQVKISEQSILSQMDKSRYVQGELLVKFKRDIAAASLEKVHQAMGASVIKKYSLVSNLEHVRLPQGTSVRDAVVEYMSNPDVEYVEPNYIARIQTPVIPDDAAFGDQWALWNLGTYANGTSGADIKAPLAWNISVGTTQVMIAVLDTGIDFNHPDLAGNIWPSKGFNFVTCLKFDEFGNCEISGVPNDDPMDDFGHGTHVAGIIGAAGGNGIGVAGVMWSVNLMAVKVLNAEGEGSAADIVAGIQYAVNNGAKVINASLGGSEFSQSVFDAVSAANSAGVLFVAAAGNDGSNNDVTPFYPASFDLPNIIAVAATDQNDNLVAFSNFGAVHVHIAAPGVYIVSTIPNGGFGTLEYLAGTSMAAPHVSGVAGLLMSYYNGALDGHHNSLFNIYQVRTAILANSDREEDGYPDLATLKGKINTEGRLNAFRALACLAVPSDLFAEAKSPGLVDITWTDNSTGEAGFNLERSTNGTTFTTLKTLPADSTFYQDKSVAQGTTYYYRVKVFNDFGESFYSNTSSTTVPTVHHSQGGGCSVGGRQNVPTAVADVAILLIPVAVAALARRRR